MIEKLYNAIESELITVSDISEKYNVNERTVQRWLSGETKPKLEIQLEINNLIELDNIQSISRELKRDEEMLKIQVDNMLLGIRESFYRWGKYSTRNEALEELSKLVLAQIGLIQDGDIGLHNFPINTLSTEGFADHTNNALKKILGKHSELEFLGADYRLALKNDQINLVSEISAEFKKVDWSKISSLTKLDLFNEIFGRFLANSFVDEKEMGQYLTPIEMTRFMVQMTIEGLNESELNELTDPVKCKNFGYILDPSCGAGSFLVEIVHQLLPMVTSKYGQNKAKLWLQNMGNFVLTGIDKSERMFRLTVYNFASLGIPCENIYSLNSLDVQGNKEVLTQKLNGKTRIILTNPPFGAEFSGNSLKGFRLYNEWSTKYPNKIDSELLFIEKYIDWLTPGGYCTVVVPDSVLTNKGLFQDLRKGIHSYIELKAVVSFPSETFSAAGTSTKTSVLSFIKGSNPKSLVYFGICQNVGFKVITKGSTKVKVSLVDSDLNGIQEEMRKVDKKLIFGRKLIFDDNFFRWDANYHASLTETEHELLNRKSSSEVYLRDVAELINDRLDPRRVYTNFHYIEISDVLPSGIVKSKILKAVDAPSRARKQVKRGDVLASTVRPEQKKVGYVIDQSDDGAICTTGLAVLRPKGIESSLLVELMKSDFVTKQLMRNNIGIAYPAIEEGCFLEILLPIKKEQLQQLNVKAQKIDEIKLDLLSREKSYKSDIINSTNEWLREANN